MINTIEFLICYLSLFLVIICWSDKVLKHKFADVKLRKLKVKTKWGFASIGLIRLFHRIFIRPNYLFTDKNMISIPDIMTFVKKEGVYMNWGNFLTRGVVLWRCNGAAVRRYDGSMERRYGVVAA